MASLYPLNCNASSRGVSASRSFQNQNKTQISVIRKIKYNYPRVIQGRANKDQDRETSNFIDRRNMLIGLGSLYGATTAGLDAEHTATAAPIGPPDLSKCGPAHLPAGAAPINCCPPPGTKIIDFQLPCSSSTPLRVRQAAHLVDDEYVAKYTKAYELMRALPDNDPRSFKQQANIHCAYCDGAYDQSVTGFPKMDIYVHGSWLFLPFHRYYLYFHEKILGSLIGDPTFALPFWNWDTPAGMKLPSIFAKKGSSLYDEFRDAKHQPPYLLDLNYHLHVDPNLPAQQQYTNNLTTMYRQVVGAKTATLFLGSPYRAGEAENPGAGTIEHVPHGPVHNWVGDTTQPNLEDMGDFYSAARDPIFYAHHSNCDRMWTIWKGFGGKRKDFTDPDFLNAAFLFYDENKQLVRVKIKDCLKQENLRYKYQIVKLPWLQTKPVARVVRKVKKKISWKRAALTTKFPIFDKEHKEEILIISGIKLHRGDPIKIDVFINDEDEVGPESTEFAGSFTNVTQKHGRKDKKMIRTHLKLGITDILEDLHAENDEDVLVTIIPRTSGRKKAVVTIEGINIEFAS
ncbi:hypothetical protein MKW98_010134 [Papaver atlanticum]|uniref:Tyrosinase copper-binding domain-containing protein n=1 Tax=Papaver atlanticum TaxID=357466 RepID=A0AAD4RYT2_9MAGN|nr:hypothetical protein MKW98_010134 [Papaver atlanticum]